MKKEMKYQRILINRMRFLNKRIFNPLILKFAGSSYSPVSIIRHIGRRSGITYTTPVIVQSLFNRFLFILPYGKEEDWYRNVLAAGQATVVWRGKEYPVDNPESLVGSADLQALPPILRVIIRIVGAGHFIQMKLSKVIGHSVH
jgi:deazaflavin-dependent oxidoreductase (nitroreductase family)